MSTRRVLAFSGALAFAALVAGCGVQPTAPFGLGQYGPGYGVRADAEAQALVTGLKGFGAQLKTFSGTVRFWETDGKEVSTNAAEIYLAQPNRIRANVTEATSALKRNAKMVYLGDKKITVKVAIIKKTLPYDDPQVLSLRGYRIDQTDLKAIVRGVTHPGAKPRYVGSGTFNGTKVEMVEVQSPELLPGTTRQVVSLDAQTFAPLRLEAFEGQKVVYKMELSGIKINPPLSDSLFKL